MAQIADVLAAAAASTGGVDGADLDSVRSILEHRATEAADAAGWSPDEPLRLAKASTGWLLRCTKRATAPRGDTIGAALALGALVDAVAKVAALRPVEPRTAVDAGLDWLQADAGAAEVVGWIDALEGAERDAFFADAAERSGRLLAAWPDPQPWARIDEWARVALCGGAVSLAGRLDVVFGGPPSAQPCVVVEVKSGAWRDEHRADAHLYALLVAMRDRQAPHAVVTVCAADGRVNVEPVRAGVLEAAAERVGVALERAAALAAGEVPIATPGSWCGACPLQTSCAPGQAFLAGVSR